MSIKEQIIKYQKTRDEEVFRRIYESIHKGGTLIASFVRKYGLDRSDVESLINEKLLDVVDSHDPRKGNFSNEVYTAVKYGCIDLLRRKTYEEEFIEDVMYENDDGEYEEVYEILQVAPTTTEDDILNEVRKRRDQRQLIANLIEKADKPTKLSITAFLSTDSYRQAAEDAGTCHKTVKARIERMSRNFDANQFGEPSDYLIVPTIRAV